MKNIERQELASLPVKVALVSHVLPPSPSGQAVVLYRLFCGLDPSDYILLSRQDYGHNAHSAVQGSSAGLPAKYFHLRTRCQFRRPKVRGVGPVVGMMNMVLQVLCRGWSIARIAARERCKAIVACSGDLIDLPAGYLASWLLRVPFYAHMFDDYVNQWVGPRMRRFAMWVESVFARRRSTVVVPNEFLEEVYKVRHSISPVILRNPCEDSGDLREIELPWPARDGEVRIVYTGAVYHAHYDAFQNLIEALRDLDRPDLKLHVYTAQSPAELRQQGVDGPVEFHMHLSPSEISEVQRTSDILFLPLALASPIQEVVRTSAPGKMGDYLASARPVLVHAPADSFVSWYFKKHDCGVVVNEGSPQELATAIRLIIQDAGLRERLAKNALARAQGDFSLQAAKIQLMRILGSS